MGVGLNTMLAALGTGSVALSKISNSFGKGGQASEAAGKEASDKEAKSAAIDEANMSAQLEGTELQDQILKRKQDENVFAQGLAREGAFFAQGTEKKKQLNNLQALQRAKQSLADEAAANDIRMRQIKTVMQIKGYGGKK